jgi:hypothetical protein
VTVDPELVHAAASRYLETSGHDGTVSVSGGIVTVTVAQVVELQLLSAIGVADQTVHGTARTRLVRGVEGPDT